jgi:hypothetical protein
MDGAHSLVGKMHGFISPECSSSHCIILCHTHCCEEDSKCTANGIRQSSEGCKVYESGPLNSGIFSTLYEKIGNS